MTDNSIDNNRDKSIVPIVGIGASAGGLDALERFFQHTPLDSGLAFVVVQHLAPDFNSLMDELLARHTKLPIYEVKDGMEVAPNTIYLLPPRANMIYINGQLQLSEREKRDVLNLPIDIFFRSLAQGMGSQAVGVVLSGTGSDGSQGVKEMQRAGGLIAVQEPTTALFDGMPRNAITTQAVHIVAQPEDIPRNIIAHRGNQTLNAGGVPLMPSLLSDSAEEVVRGPGVLDVIDSMDAANEAHLAEENELSIILALLRSHFQIDFTQYKPETVIRRIQRRFQMNRLENAAAYLQLLQSNQSELDTLYRDLLIDVTRFFRDAVAFETLRPIIEKMVQDASLDDDIRVWVAGCATGEEAYTLAILFAEALTLHTHPVRVQIFATDAHPESLAIASKGRYSAERVAGMPTELAEKYLIPVNDSQDADKGADDGTDTFVVSDTIRQIVVFAQHNLLQDPPFTRLSLVTCRNVLIYFKPHAQERILSQFFFGLKTEGTLFLGPSEHVGRLKDDFSVQDRRWRIFTKLSARYVAVAASQPQNRQISRHADALPRKSESTAKLNLYESLIDSQMPPGLLLNERHELVRTFGDAGKYLRIVGDPSYQILDLVDIELSTALRAGFHRAKQDKKTVVYTGVRVPKNPHAKNARGGSGAYPADAHDANTDDAAVVVDSFVRLRVKVTPLLEKKLDQTYFLVSLTEMAHAAHGQSRAFPNTLAEGDIDAPSVELTGTHRSVLPDERPDYIDGEYVDGGYIDGEHVGGGYVDSEYADDDYVYTDLDEASRDQFTLIENELLDTREYLQTTVEELETTNEEMQSTNEELIASNEELQSTNEELHSVNEELYTVNSEYQRKIDELQVLTDDMTNLQNSTQIATLFLDRNLRVRHYTPAVIGILHLLPQDIERPVDHLRPDIDLDHKIFVEYLQTVLQDKIPIEIEVMQKERIRWLMRILPYYTHEKQADGIVLTFTDITSIHQVEEALSAQEKLMQHIVTHSLIHVDMYDVQKQIPIAADKDLREKLGYTQAEIQEMPARYLYSIGHPDERKAVDEWIDKIASMKRDGYVTREFRLRHKDGSWRWFLRTSWVHEQNDDRSPKLIARTAVDITKQKEMANALASRERLLTDLAAKSPVYIYLFDQQAGQYVYINRDMRKDLGYSEAEIAEMPRGVMASIGHPDDLAQLSILNQRLATLGPDEAITQTVRLRHKDGSWRYYLRSEIIYERDEAGQVKLIRNTVIDVTAIRQLEDKLRKSESLYQYLFSHAADAIYLVDMQGNIVDGNEQAEREFGYSHEELTTLTISDLNLNFDKEALLARFQTLSIGDYIEREGIHIRKDKSCFPVEGRGVKVERNNQEYMLVTVHNLSGRKESQETIIRLNEQLAAATANMEQERDQVVDALMESEERYRLHIEATTAVLWVSNEVGHFIAPQTSWGDYTGQPWPQQREARWIDMFHEADRSVVEQAWHLGIQKREHFMVAARLWSANNGDYQPVLLRAVPLLKDGKLAEWIGSITDTDIDIDAKVQLREQRMQLLYEITSHIATDVEVQLSEALRLAAHALNSQYAAIGRIDDDTYLVRHLFASGSEMEIGQALPLDETYCSIVLEQSDVLVVNHMADSEYADRRCYQRMGFESYIGTMIRVNGVPYGNVCFFGESPKSPAYTKADEDFVRLLAGWIGFAIERLRVDSSHAMQSISLEATNAELMRSNQDLDTFVYIASHDLKEPLRGINQYAQFLEEDYADRLDEEGVQMLSSLREQSSRAERLIEDLRFYSRIGRAELGLEKIDLTTLIQGVLAQIEARLNENDVEVVVADNLPTVVYNHARLSTVFQNLIVNAIKYNINPKKRVEIGIFYAGPPPEIADNFNRSDLPTEDLADIDLLSQLSYGAKEANSPLSMPWLPEGEPILYVRDNGIGIEERNIARIFGMFKRLHGHGEYGGGTGAGLPIVRRILERNGGRIWVESTVGDGTQFNFTLGEQPLNDE